MPLSSDTSRTEAPPPYQVMLRAIGAHLDRQQAERVRLIEDQDAFIAYFSLADGTARVERHPFEDLLSSGSVWPRNRWNRGQRAHLSPLGAADYEDVLRALGYELDQVRAEALLLDELADGLLVTYQYLNPSESYLVRKRMAVLGTDEMATILETARGRRVYQKPTLLQRLAG